MIEPEHAAEHARLERLGTAALDAALAHPDWRPGDRLIVGPSTADVGGFGSHGYGSATEIVSDLLQIAQALSQAPDSGVQLLIGETKLN
jgi:hypothetical protein